ncbi:MAG: WG repeat-containing protein [Alphaproteobacteria bacterium]|nr:WG repeat-containing protein [Alphaproteobacteria bacterium]
MRLVDEEEIEVQKRKNQKTKRLIIISIVLLLILCSIIIALIIYRVYNPTKVTTYIDGIMIPNFDAIVDFQTDENGETQIYIPIRDFATYLNAVNEEFGYQTFKGDYNPKTEEENKCYIIREGYEVAVFTEKSKTIYKLNLQSKSEEYEECHIDKDVFENNGKLYASSQGIEKGYNVYFSYDEKRKIITIYTMDYLIQSHQAFLENKTIGNYGQMQIDGNNYTNLKSIFDGLLIVQSANNKYGIIKTDDYSSFILEPQYDKIDFVADSSTFLVESNGKVGLFSKDGKRKIDLVYDEITSMGQDSNLYLVQVNKMYGVVDENGNIIIYPEYEEIGIDVSSYYYNGVKNGYILLNELIPVSQYDKWAFFNTKGKMITDGFIYENIGCSSIRSGNNLYPLLEISDYNVIVVGDEYGKYSFMDLTGDDTFLQFLFDEIYIKMSAGEISYWMTYKGEEYEVLKYLKQVQEK